MKDGGHVSYHPSERVDITQLQAKDAVTTIHVAPVANSLPGPLKELQ